MSDFRDVVISRRMVRAFRPDPVPRAQLATLVDLASRSPSAGKTQGWSAVVLEGAATARFWDATMSTETRSGFRWKFLFDAPVIMLSFADPQAYLARYAEHDKSRSRLGESLDAWPAPYWTIDASFATMTLLLAAQDAGLGALFFGVFQGETELRSQLGVPGHLQLIGAIALGYERTPSPGEATDRAFGSGASADRRRASPEDVLHYGTWGTH